MLQKDMAVKKIQIYCVHNDYGTAPEHMYNICQLLNTKSQTVSKPISKHLFWQYYMICALFIKVADIQNSSLSGILYSFIISMTRVHHIN